MRRWLLFILLVCGLIIFFSLNLDSYFTFDTLKQHRQQLLSLAEAHYLLAVLIYIATYIIAVAISVPGGATFLTLVSGFLFGIVFGTIYVLVGATLGATLTFLAVRLALGSWIAKKTNQWLEKTRSDFQQGAFQYLFFLRFIPIFPFWVVNIIPALLGVKTSTFMITTAIGIIPGTIIYVALGNGLGKFVDYDYGANLDIISDPTILFPLLGLAFLSILPILYKWIKSNIP
ncbi:MAG: hypothetical protein A3F11_11730 [Gammaproteobacteria bacterium RIFCSPHIGHO2_12_FULL_37_14]|nr:MAG: hypothetical protein A3F11_11730 [Gammaproteobacteria bacterium RIFCSPHIGHO2_12_FULL_37_14]